MDNHFGTREVTFQPKDLSSKFRELMLLSSVYTQVKLFTSE